MDQPANPEAVIWRYMDLSKFLDLLRTSSLFLAPAIKLSDPFEGSVPKLQSIDLIKKLTEHPDVRAEFEKNLTDGPWKDFESWLAMVEKMAEVGRGLPHLTYISCWHMAEIEFFAMWKLYSSSSDSICIRSTYDRLQRLLPDEVFLGKVSYDFELGVNVGNALTRFFKKRASFAYEQEIRAVFMGMGESAQSRLEKGGAVFSVDLNELIEAVYVNPDAPAWFYEVERDVCEKYRLVKEVKQSALGGDQVGSSHDGYNFILHCFHFGYATIQQSDAPYDVERDKNPASTSEAIGGFRVLRSTPPYKLIPRSRNQPILLFMHESGLDISEEFYAYKDRASGYIARASHFPFQWGLPNGARNKNGFPIEFFRWDRRVLKRMVDRAEHIIRCLIIWMAWARLRSGLVEPVYSVLRRNPSTSGSGRPAPSRCSCGAQRGSLEPVLCELCSREQNQNAPVHHLYSIRGLPLYDLRVAPFSVSLPEKKVPRPLDGGEGFRVRGCESQPHPQPLSFPGRRGEFSDRSALHRETGSRKRIRNDKVFSSEILIMRMERLGKLYEEIDTRAARIAGLWLGRMKNREEALLPWWEKGWDEGGARSANHSLDGENSIPLTPAPLPTKGERGAPTSRDAPNDQRSGATALSGTRRNAVSITPIKSSDPPPDMMEGAPDDERDDVLALHDGAIRAAELFTRHCV